MFQSSQASEYRARHGANGLNADHVSNLKKLLPRLEDAIGALALPPLPGVCICSVVDEISQHHCLQVRGVLRPRTY